MTVEAVIFDWGGTLTPWHDIDFQAEAAALARAVVPATDVPTPLHVRLLESATQQVWGRARDEQRSATVADLFVEAGLEFDHELLEEYRGFWEPHTVTDPAVRPLFERLRADGIRIGILSNTLWPRDWHEDFFRRDGVLHLIDGAVYSSEIPWTKPSRQAFGAALESVGVSDPGRAVFVGDRLFDDVWGAHHAGLKAIHVPHSNLPIEQVGHTEGTPDAVAHALADIPALIAGW